MIKNQKELKNIVEQAIGKDEFSAIKRKSKKKEIVFRRSTLLIAVYDFLKEIGNHQYRAEYVMSVIDKTDRTSFYRIRDGFNVSLAYEPEEATALHKNYTQKLRDAYKENLKHRESEIKDIGRIAVMMIDIIKSNMPDTCQSKRDIDNEAIAYLTEELNELKTKTEKKYGIHKK